VKKIIQFLCITLALFIFNACSSYADVPYEPFDAPIEPLDTISPPQETAYIPEPEQNYDDEYIDEGPVLYGCTRDPGMTYEILLERLNSKGFDFEYAGTDKNPTMLSVVGRHIQMGDNLIAIYEYESTEAMKRDAEGISPSGFGISRPDPTDEGLMLHTEVSWIYWPHWFKADVIIVRYVGEDRLIIDALNNILGINFAGYGVNVNSVIEQPFNLQIAVANDEFLSTFEHLHMVDYTLAREARSDAPVEPFHGRSLAIWTDVPLYDVALMTIEHDFIASDLIFIPLETFGHVTQLQPGEAFVINNYIGWGTMPWSGITFVDENGDRRYFWMQQDESGMFDPDPFDPDIFDKFEDGYLQVAIVTQTGGGNRRYFTMNKDENGYFDPVRWLGDNEHLWVPFTLMEFQNRTDELP